jgi:hypothetical protein
LGEPESNPLFKEAAIAALVYRVIDQPSSLIASLCFRRLKFAVLDCSARRFNLDHVHHEATGRNGESSDRFFCLQFRWTSLCKFIACFDGFDVFLQPFSFATCVSDRSQQLRIEFALQLCVLFLQSSVFISLLSTGIV